MIRLTIRQLEYFEALAETRHFGRAAEMVGISQPALSAQVAEMEQRLGCRLFDRGAGGVRLSEQGAELRPRIERVLSQMREIENGAMRSHAALEGRFRLGIIPTVAPYLLPAMLPAVRADYPSLQLELREAVTETLVEETLAGRLDGFVAAAPLDQRRLVVQDLFADRFHLAVPADDPGFASPPVAPESPALERLMLLEEGHCMREQALAVCGKVRPAAMANYGATSLTTLLQMVAHGHGVTLVPEIALPSLDTTPGISVFPFEEPAPARMLCLAWRRSGDRGVECAMLAATIAALASGRRDVDGQQHPERHHHQEA